MRRGEIWTVAGGANYIGEPRPAVILKDNRFDTGSVTMCPFTTDPTEAPLFRLKIASSEGSGLRDSCWLMVDEITTVRRSKLGDRLGVLDDADLLRLNRTIVVFLGIAATR